jgi:hypothetical protein
VDSPGGIVDQLVAHYGIDKDAAVKGFLEERYMPQGSGSRRTSRTPWCFSRHRWRSLSPGRIWMLGGRCEH